MRGRDIGRFITPNGRSTERELKKEQYDPKDRQPPKYSQVARIFQNPNAKRDYRDAD